MMLRKGHVASTEERRTTKITTFLSETLKATSETLA
jgi:hypothetical protein